MQAFDWLLGSNSVISIKFWHLMGLKKRKIQNLSVKYVLKNVKQRKIIFNNPEFLSNQANIRRILPTYERVIFIKFHKDWPKTVNFLVMV